MLNNALRIVSLVLTFAFATACGDNLPTFEVTALAPDEGAAFDQCFKLVDTACEALQPCDTDGRFMACDEVAADRCAQAARPINDESWNICMDAVSDFQCDPDNESTDPMQFMYGDDVARGCLLHFYAGQ